MSWRKKSGEWRKLDFHQRLLSFGQVQGSNGEGTKQLHRSANWDGKGFITRCTAKNEKGKKAEKQEQDGGREDQREERGDSRYKTRMSFWVGGSERRMTRMHS